MKLIRRNMQMIPMTNMLHIRFMPEGATGKQWANYPFIEEFICVPDVLHGTASLDTVVKSVSGTYEYRCFMMYHFATEEKPEFYLISKGKVVIAEESTAIVGG
ncbi:MAG: hypothetical protein ACK58L_03340 [Planctomycetota bacterium]